MSISARHVMIVLFALAALLFVFSAYHTEEFKGYNGKGNMGVGTSSERPRQYGAIAMSNSTQAWGSSFNYKKSSEAKADAIRRCASNGASDCEVVVSFYNTCAALALKPKSDDKNDGGWGFSTGNKSTAEKYALERCGWYGGKDCRIAESICSQ